MERQRLAVIALTYVLLFCQKRIYGEEVEMKVRPGDSITLYCDCSVTLGSVITWIRNCSHENQPSLIINVRHGFQWGLEAFQRFRFIHNPYNNSHDLHITNISASDLGLYYCAKVENKVNQDEKGIISSSEVYYYGNRTTRLSLEEQVTSCSEPSAPPDCVLCWTLLFSVCPVCVFLSFICVFCLCCKKSTDAVTDQKGKSKGRNTAECMDEEVCYASLDVIAKSQKQRKTKRVQSSDFSTYAQVRTQTE